MDTIPIIIGIIALIAVLGGGGWLYRKGWSRGKAKENETAAEAARMAVENYREQETA